MKVLVLMTDGVITAQFRPKDYALADLARATTRCPATRRPISARSRPAKSKGHHHLHHRLQLGSDQTAINSMKNCATSSAHFYQASGAGIGDAFQVDLDVDPQTETDAVMRTGFPLGGAAFSATATGQRRSNSPSWRRSSSP